MQLFRHFKKVAEAGVKFPLDKSPEQDKGKFNLFYNKMSSTGNIFLVKSEQIKFLISELFQEKTGMKNPKE